jgi:UPF0176 protein
VELNSSPYVVAALYRFASLPQFEALREPLLDQCVSFGIRGTLLLASEGINGTVAGTREGIDLLLAYLKAIPELAQLDHKESFCDELPFYRMKVKLKKEIVTMGVEGIDPQVTVGRYVEPKDWNALITDPDVLLVDTRNDYEVEIGTFKGALDPNTTTFREFPEYVKNNLDPQKQKKVAMFCTGGIRCEKATAYMIEQGYDEVFHLKGGILKYLEEVPEAESLWQGECFVFDNRVSVNHKLEKGDYDQCHGCRFPITEQDKRDARYVAGVSCPRCHDLLTEDQRMRFSERQKQIQLAKQRQQVHIGSSYSEPLGD